MFQRRLPRSRSVIHDSREHNTKGKVSGILSMPSLEVYTIIDVRSLDGCQEYKFGVAAASIGGALLGT